ncbi:hypothetical protein LPJ59_001038 [Coemansia sp. RSA 2399]|nr:hypothetical protein LPJ59_001038 [Coemansia sp. RSA 2399]KAJ1907222.1 hypothetical protein LPJ81_000893 [Coemansia sp. IMI 209127]
MKIIDIGANLTDPVFRGKYRGKQAHDDDIEHILQRARSAGVVGMMVTGGSLHESKDAVSLCRQHQGLFSTAGCHPTRSGEVDRHPGGADAYFAKLRDLIQKNKDKIVAVGECGLDYDRLHFSDKETQNRHFVRHFDLAEATGLPLFLHDRNTGDDFVRIVRENRRKFSTGVVHSFTGTAEELRELLALDLYIGVNGCSLKTDENLAVVKLIPVDRLMIETDCPYCEIRPTHASYKLLDPAGCGEDGWKAPDAKRKERWCSDCLVKGRNEPCTIRSVLQVVARLHNISEEDLAASMFENTRKVFFANVEHGF